MSDSAAARKAEAERRRNLEGNILYQDLGEPIQKLLQAVSMSITNEELALLSKVSVRLLTKVFNMLNAQEDPDKILSWLREEAKRQAGGNKADTDIQKKAAKDPIAFYKELEKRNEAMLDSFRKAEEDRERERLAGMAERKRRREEAERKAKEDAERAAKNGDTTDAVDRLNKQDAADIAGAFNRFVDKNGTFDNTNATQDNEWWKKDEYRRDYEKNKRKGKQWTRVVEGGTQQIPDSEIAAREEWYKSYCWWKSDKFRRDWLASRDAEWWKEETYIKEWQDKGDKGCMWLAADETTGFNKKGHRRPAAQAELDRRTSWYKDNGPKGIVKMWCALAEGQQDRCTLEEKRERDDYYKNGDWWKADGFVRKAFENPSTCDAITKAGAANEDREWWKDEQYRRDFCRDGKKWKLASEKAAVQGQEDALATEAELARRQEWFQNNWWKTDALLEDFQVNGEKGSKWIAASEADLAALEKNPNAKVNACNISDRKVREDWFRSAEERQWWKDPTIIRDWEQNGKAGKKWTAAWRESALDSTGDVNTADPAEIAKRDEWFKKNFWKTDKYVKDFQAHGNKGTAWKAANRQGHEDKDWWKQGDMQRAWLANRAATLTPFWQEPESVADYFQNGAAGKKWTAKNAAAASMNKGDEVRADASELAEREAFFQNNWWRAPKYQRDFAANGKHGKLWKAAAPNGEGGEASTDELRRRREFFASAASKKHAPSFTAMLESDAVNALVNSKFSKWGRLQKREEFYKNNWWKVMPEVKADFLVNGANSKLLKAKTPEAAAAGLGDDPAFQASPSEIQKRIAYFQSGSAAEDWWKTMPELKADFLANGSKSKLLKAKTRAAAVAGLGDDPAFQATPQEILARVNYLQGGPSGDEDWWKTMPELKAEFAAVGAASKLLKAKTHEAALAGLGDVPAFQASSAEIQKRIAFLQSGQTDADDWWKTMPEVRADFLANGSKSKLLKAKTREAAAAGLGDDPAHQASPTEIQERIAFFQNGPTGDDDWWKTNPELKAEFKAVGASSKLLKAKTLAAAVAGLGDDPAFQATPTEIQERIAYLQNNGPTGDEDWWKTMPELKAEFAAVGAASKLLKAKTREAAVAGLGDDPAFQATPAEIQERIAYLQSSKDDAITDDNWWKDGAFAKEWAGGKAVPFWQNPDVIQDFLDSGASGKKWTAKNAASAAQSLGDKPEHRAAADELPPREDFYRKHFWQATKYQADFESNGDKGTLWTMSEPGGKGEVVSEGELKARQAWYKPTMKWQLADKPEGVETPSSADAVEVLDRDEWFKKNWWKNPIVKNDYLAHGKASKLLRAANADVVILGLESDPKYHATPEEISHRIEYFETCGDNEWWKAPAAIEDYVKWHKEGAVWQSRNLVESKMSMGIENPAPSHELAERSEWYEGNYWKTPDAIRDYQTNGANGHIWKAGRDGTTPVAASELPLREAWLKANTCCDPTEEARRRTWLQQQLTDDEAVMRRTWLTKKGADAKRIHVDELSDLLAQINDGHKPTDDQLQMIIDAIRARRSELANDDADEIGEDGITQEEFITAVATTNFYVSATDEERLRAEQEALDALQREEMERQDEVAGHLAMEAQEELDNAGFEEHEEVDGDEAAFLDEMEEEDLGDRVNEDDGEVDEGAWQEFLEQQGDDTEELTDEQLAALQAEEEERMAAEAARQEAEAAVWEDAEYGGEEGEDDAVEHPADLDEDAKEELEAVVNEEWDEVAEDEEYEEEEEIDEMQMEEKGAPMQWKLPLREVTNPQYLKAYFTVIKYTPSHSFLGGKQKRVWVVDHFTRCFYNLEKSGKIKKEHAANKLLQLERNLVDCTRLRLMFFDASHSYELQFFNARERERFYESASAIRPSIRVYAPDLTNQDANVEACTTTIDGVGPNSVSVVCNNAQGKPVNRELTGECKVNASKLITEPLTVWVGTFNLSGARPPKNKQELAAWMPKDKYDIYAIAVQEASYRKEESEWFDYVQAYLGREYLTLASMNLWDTLLIVLTRKKHLLKITNVEGSTKATVHKAVCGTKGGIGISMRYLETSMCFITCHLAARIERTQMRNTNLEEIVDNLQLGIRETDFTNQFNHVFFFGDFNYRTEVDAPTAERLIADKNYAELISYDQFTQQRTSEGILAGFNETPVTFAPTYRLQPGTGKYMIEKGNASSFCDRVLTRSMANTWIKCTSYKAVPDITFSEHSPVCATYIIRCVRPVLSCFMKSQRPIPVFHFKNIAVKEHNGVIINKPAVIISSPFFGSTKPFDSKTSKTQNPSWSASEIPSHEAITQVQEFIETGHIIFILREGAEKREDKAHRGSGHLTMLGHVVGQEGVEQDFEVDLMNHGRRMGKIVGRYMWVGAK